MKYLQRVFVLLFATGLASAAYITEENFDCFDCVDWQVLNESSPVGSTSWFQGNPGVFSARSGTPDSYVAASFNSAAFGGDVNNWLFTRPHAVANGDTFSFWTRTTLNPAVAPDRLLLRFSDNGSSITPSDFDVVLSVNPDLTLTDYPDEWTQFTYTVSGLDGVAIGRFAFNYLVPDTTMNADYIGIDDVVFVSSVPEPSAFWYLAPACLALWAFRSRTRRWRSLPLLSGMLLASVSVTAQEKTEAPQPESRMIPLKQKQANRDLPGRVYQKEGTQGISARTLRVAPPATLPRPTKIVKRLPGGIITATAEPGFMTTLIAVKDSNGKVRIQHGSAATASEAPHER